MQVKGAAIRSTLAAIQQVRGRDALLAVSRAMPAEQRAIAFDQPPLAMGWYPVEVLAAVHVAVRDELAGGDWALSHKLGMEAAKIDFGHIYRLALRAVTPMSIWDRIERMWRTYNTRGRFRWVDRRPGIAHAILQDLSGYNRGMWNAAAGRAEQLMLMAGARAAEVRIIRATDSLCEYDAMWLE
jgi:hypothetical protein